MRPLHRGKGNDLPLLQGVDLTMGRKVEQSYVCRLCATEFTSTQHRKAFRKCPACKEPQNWSTVAPEPRWFPGFLPTRENGRSKNARWTGYVLVLLFGAPVLFPLTIYMLVLLVMLPFKGPTEYRIPDVTGMNLQSAQDCLQEHGFFNLDDQSVQSKFQIFDRNWVVDKQTKVGVTQSRTEEIVLWVVRPEGSDYGSTRCPKP